MPGRLEVVCGPVGSGKSRELDRRLAIMRASAVSYVLFTPEYPSFFRHVHELRSDAVRTGTDRRAIEFMMHVTEKFPDTAAIAVDGTNFYDAALVEAVQAWLLKQLRVICVGLDLDFAGMPFHTMAQLLAFADEVTKLSALCTRCRAPATRSQLVEMNPDMPEEIAMQTAYYEPRCIRCHEVPKEHKQSRDLRWIYG